MNVIAKLTVAAALLVLNGCGGSQGFVADGSTTNAASNAAAITMFSSSPQMGTGTASSVIVTARVKDANNNLLAGEAVSFATDSGEIAADATTTDAQGTITATLFSGVNQANRSVIVTATAGTLSSTYTVTASGTAISINGAQSLAVGDQSTYTISLKDSDGLGIPNQAVTVSAGSNTFTAVDPTSLQTDINGQLDIELTAVASGDITVSALGSTASLTLTVSNDAFAISSKDATGAENSEIEVGECRAVSATWRDTSGAVANGTVTFVATRGEIYGTNTCAATASSATTNASGVATVYIKSPNPGSFVLTASTSTVSATKDLSFIATVPDDFAVQVDKSIIGTNQSATVTATVRDADNNLVKNATVRFRISTDTTGGSISPGEDVTDSLGRATAVYTATDATSARDGVMIEATVVGLATSKTVTLTVGGANLFVRFGMSNVVATSGDASYAYPGAVFVTDASGNPVEGATVNLSVIPVGYYKGERVWNGVYWEIASWDDVALVAGDPYGQSGPNAGDPCLNEDMILGDVATDLNGRVDAGEDINGNGTLEPGNFATVDPSVTTNANGYADFSIYYPKAYANWTNVLLTATASVAGSESRTSSTFELLALASEVTSEETAPPGAISPLGAGVDTDGSGVIDCEDEY